MSDDNKQTDDEIKDITDSEPGTDTAENSEETSIDEVLTEPKQEETTKPSIGEVQRDKAVNAWTQKILNGEADLDNLPPAQRWMRPFIENKIGAYQKEPEIDQIVERKMAEKEEKQNFTSLKDFLKDQKLSPTQKATLATEFKDLRANGVSPFKALEKAIKLAQIPMDKEAEQQAQLKAKMALPRPGNYGGKSYQKEITEENFQKLPEKDRMELYAQMEKE